MNALIIGVESAGYYAGHNVKINGVQVYHRPYDGSRTEDVEVELATALGELLREKLGYTKAPPEEDQG